MIPLNEEQLEEVKQHLAHYGLQGELEEEFLDHVCCTIEEQMEAGLPFHLARQRTLETWNLRHARRLRRGIFYHLKLKPMLIKLTAAAAMLAGVYFTAPMPQEQAPVANVHYQIPDPPTASPLAGVQLTDAHSGYGMRNHPISGRRILHRGMDFKAEPGTPVLATAPGRVVFAGEDGKYGNVVRILHEDGYVTVYSHLQDYSVERSQEVALGETIGAVGSTGESTGPHLHYELIKDDAPVDPLAMIKQ